MHGSSIGFDLDDRYLGNIKYICELAIMWMAYDSCQEHWQSSKGYRDFVKYILENIDFIEFVKKRDFFLPSLRFDFLLTHCSSQGFRINWLKQIQTQ